MAIFYKSLSPTEFNSPLITRYFRAFLGFLLRAIGFDFVLKQVVPILVSANISAIQVSPLPALNHQSKFRKV